MDQEYGEIRPVYVPYLVVYGRKASVFLPDTVLYGPYTDIVTMHLGRPICTERLKMRHITVQHIFSLGSATLKFTTEKCDTFKFRVIDEKTDNSYRLQNISA